MSGGATHQGIVAFAAAKDYSTVDDILEYAESKGEAPFVVVLDEVEDPHNLGAIIRTQNVPEFTELLFRNAEVPV